MDPAVKIEDMLRPFDDVNILDTKYCPEIDAFYQFNITKEQLNTIYRAASVISAPTLSVVANSGNVVLSVGDPNTPKSNSFTTDIGNANVEFDARLGIENL